MNRPVRSGPPSHYETKPAQEALRAEGRKKTNWPKGMMVVEGKEGPGCSEVEG
jgi:hypothetical protein